MTRHRWTAVVATVTAVPALLAAWCVGYALDVACEDRRWRAAR